MQLIRFLKKLSHTTVTLRLKNGSSVSGTIVGVDMSMNTHLKTAKLMSKDGENISFDDITIRGSFFINKQKFPFSHLLIICFSRK